MVRYGEGTKGTVEYAQHAVAGSEAGHAGAHLSDHTSAFEAKRPRFTGVHAEGIEHIAEIETCSSNGDTDLSRAEGSAGFGMRKEGETIEATLARHMEAPRRSAGRKYQRFSQARSSKPGYVHGPIAQGELGLSGGEGSGQSAERGIVVVDVDEDKEPFGVLCLGRAQKAPEGCVDEVEHVLVGSCGDGASREHDEPGGGKALVRDPGLKER
jgi:hypothetical protein